MNHYYCVSHTNAIHLTLTSNPNPNPNAMIAPKLNTQSICGKQVVHGYIVYLVSVIAYTCLLKL